MAQNCFQIYGLSQKSKTLEPQSWWFAPKMVQSNIVPEHLIVKRQTSYQTSYQFLAVSHKFPSTQQTRMSYFHKFTSKTTKEIVNLGEIGPILLGIHKSLLMAWVMIAIKLLPSGKLTVCYGKWSIEIDGLPIKNGDFL